MDLFTNRVANFIPEKATNPIGFFHRLSILLPIFKPLPSNHGTNPHDGAREGPACFPSPCHTPGESASGFKNLLAAHI
jgi:hypothetical protein